MFYVTPKSAKVTFIPAAVITFSWIPSKTAGYHWYLCRPLLLFKMPFESMNSFFSKNVLSSSTFGSFYEIKNFLILIAKNNLTIKVENTILRHFFL